MLNVKKITPSGYCYGVVGALKKALETADDTDTPRPIYMLGMLVHNKNITDALESKGIITLESKGKSRLELLDDIDSGTVIFTAHGVSDAVINKAKTKNLHIINASCKDVIKTHDIIKSAISDNANIIYIGKNGHPETEGALGIDANRIFLIENIEDIEKLNIISEKILITNQTTMSKWDISVLVDKIMQKYPHAELVQEICNATLVRQEAVSIQAKGLDLLIVVGDPNSNNTKKLVSVSENIAKTTAVRINSVEDIDIELLKNIVNVGVTSGASTPTSITDEVIEFLKQFDYSDPKTHNTKSNLSDVDILRLGRK